jgi:hypothetical protein
VLSYFAAFEFLKAGTDAKVVLDIGSSRDADVSIVETKKRGARSAAGSSSKRAKVVTADDHAASGAVSVAVDSDVREKQADARMKFADFCDGLLRRWDGSAFFTTAESAEASAKAVAGFAELNFMAKAQLAK